MPTPKKPSLPRLLDVEKTLAEIADPIRAASSLRFFKTGKGDYGEGDRFLGITVPDQRAVAKRFLALPLAAAARLLDSPWHEHRLTALFILVFRYAKALPPEKKAIHGIYLQALKRNKVNNWDLVDSSAECLVGAHFADAQGGLKPSGRAHLLRMAHSGHLWTRRVAMIATFHQIKRRSFEDALAIADILRGDKHDLMHKAVGWMLREIGKRDLPSLRRFLDKHAATLPRTALRYALERMADAERRKYMAAKAGKPG